MHHHFPTVGEGVDVPRAPPVASDMPDAEDTSNITESVEFKDAAAVVLPYIVVAARGRGDGAPLLVHSSSESTAPLFASANSTTRGGGGASSVVCITSAPGR